MRERPSLPACPRVAPVCSEARAGDPIGRIVLHRPRRCGRQSLVSQRLRRRLSTWHRRWRRLPGQAKSSVIIGVAFGDVWSRWCLRAYPCELPLSCSGKVVPSSSASMHRLHCLRNTARCPKCGVAFPAKDMEAHAAASAGGPDQACAAAAAGDCERLGVMRQHGADLRSAGAAGDAPIHAAARAGQAAALDFLLSQGVSVNSPNARGETPLHIACDRWRTGDAPSPEPARFVRLLLDRGCDVDARTLMGDTPMQIAQRRAFNDALLLLASVGGSLRPVRGGRGCERVIATSSSPRLLHWRLQSSRDGRQRPASAGSLKRLASAPGLVTSPPRAGPGASPTEAYSSRPQSAVAATAAGNDFAAARSASPAADAGSTAPGSAGGGLAKPPSARRMNVAGVSTSGPSLSPDQPTPRGAAASLAHGAGIAFASGAVNAAPPVTGRGVPPLS